MSIPLTNQVNFYSQRLTGDFLRMYNASVENLSRGRLQATVAFGYLPSENLDAQLREIVDAIVFGCPELFFVDQAFQFTLAGNAVTLRFQNKYAGENLDDMWERLNAEIDRIVQKALAIPKTFDRIHRINRYLCVRVKSSPDTNAQLGDAYGALILRRARCEGFAKAAKLIFDRLGIPNLIAEGEALNGESRETHAWNILEYQGAHYHFDFTWNAGTTQYDVPGQAYMFLSDALAHIEHFPKYAYPACVDESKTFWARYNGNVRYHSDLSRIKIVPFKNNYFAIARFEKPLDLDEVQSDGLTWMRDELSAYSYGSQIAYAINVRLNLLLFYMING